MKNFIYPKDIINLVKMLAEETGFTYKEHMEALKEDYKVDKLSQLTDEEMDEIYVAIYRSII